MHEEQASADLCAGQGLAGGTQPDVTAWGKSAGARDGDADGVESATLSTAKED